VGPGWSTDVPTIISHMAESLHERYDRDERHLLDVAAMEIPTDDLLDAVVDVAAPIIAASAWDSVPPDAPPRTTERYTAAGALTAMALRATRTTALTVRAGYAPEALGDVRRLFEIAGHAQRVADDDSGQYAANWLDHRGRAVSARSAFGPPDTDPMWALMSGQAHAQFDVYARMSTAFDEGRLVHQVGPQRDPLWDSIWLWYAARQLVRVLAGLLKVHPHIDQTDFLAVAEPVVAAERQLSTDIAIHRLS
jgi:hypothetical protein